VNVLPRALNPVAWWLWALGLAVAASRTSNPLLLLLIFSVLGLVVALRRPQAPWARGYRFYLLMAGLVIALRIAFSVVFAAGPVAGDHILFRLPAVPVPSWYTGVRIGGPVSAEAVLTATVDGVRLACLLCCIGAANTLANPKRALRMLPGALYELGAAVTVALSLAPQLVESVARVRAARRLRGYGRSSAGGSGGSSPRGRQRRMGPLRGIAVPILHDALDRSLRLAAAMDARGYGRTSRASTAGGSGGSSPRASTAAARRLTAGLMLTGLAGLCLGGYELLDPAVPHPVGIGGFAAGSILCVAGLALGGRRVSRSRYRPDPWRWPEWLVTASGLTSAILLSLNLGYDPAALNPGFHPLQWPTLPVLPAAAILVAALAAVAAPPPELPAPPSEPPAPATPSSPEPALAAQPTGMSR
jgi:energy-coupling factor transport system permease protein